MLKFNLKVLVLGLGLTSLVEAAPDRLESFSGQLSLDKSRNNHVLIAQRKQAKGGRRKFITGEGRTQGSSTSIDFDAAAIEGERRAPAGVTVGGNKQDHGYDLINLRLKWHSEMVKSTKNLETGRGQ